MRSTRRRPLRRFICPSLQRRRCLIVYQLFRAPHRFAAPRSKLTAEVSYGSDSVRLWPSTTFPLIPQQRTRSLHQLHGSSVPTRNTLRPSAATCAQSWAYSITSSARSKMDCGIVIPSSLAVFRLITSPNLVGRCTAILEGLSPFKIRPV
jgi:hypothetical protein